MFRKENGVTLVALVITIIVLLILAGVTISMVLGNDGILKQASDATAAHTLSDIKDKAALAAATVRTAEIAENYDNDTVYGEFTTVKVRAEMLKLVDTGVELGEVNEDSFTVTINNVLKYTVTVNTTARTATVVKAGSAT